MERTAETADYPAPGRRSPPQPRLRENNLRTWHFTPPVVRAVGLATALLFAINTLRKMSG